MSTLAEKPEVAASQEKPYASAESPQHSNTLVLWVMRCLALLATVVSGYLVWVALSAGNVIGCGGAMDCEEVLSSSWSKWFGLPVSIPAFSMYVSLLFALVFAGSIAPPNVRRLAWTITAALTALAAAAAVWFIGLQLFVVKEYCTWCFTIHVSGCGLFLLALVAGGIGMSRKLAAAAASAAVGMALLVAGQFLQPETSGAVAESYDTLGSLSDGTRPCCEGEEFEPQLPLGMSISELEGFRIIQAEPADDSADAAGADPEAAEEDAADPDTEPPNAEDQRLVVVLGGIAELDAYHFPMIGSPESEHLVIELFDYTCPHCRQMHHHLAEAESAFEGHLGVIMLAAPLNVNCNKYVQYTHKEHRTACELAAFALAVWRIDPTKFESYHQWLMHDKEPPSVADARSEAVRLIGSEPLAEQLESAELWERLAIGPEVYRLANTGPIPKLLLPEIMYSGKLSIQEVYKILDDQLGLERVEE